MGKAGTLLLNKVAPFADLMDQLDDAGTFSRLLSAFHLGCVALKAEISRRINSKTTRQKAERF